MQRYKKSFYSKYCCKNQISGVGTGIITVYPETVKHTIWKKAHKRLYDILILF